jgi:hypothetical protein
MHWALVIAGGLLISSASALLLTADLQALQPLLAVTAAG